MPELPFPRTFRLLEIMEVLEVLKQATAAVAAMHDVPKDDSWVGQYYAAVKEKLAAEARLWKVYDG